MQHSWKQFAGFQSLKQMQMSLLLFLLRPQMENIEEAS